MTKELSFAEMENLQGGIEDEAMMLPAGGSGGFHIVHCAIGIWWYNMAAEHNLMIKSELNQLMASLQMAGC